MLILRPEIDNTGLLELLLQHGATHSPDATGNTPLHYAMMLRKMDSVKKLLEYGANPKSKSPRPADRPRFAPPYDPRNAYAMKHEHNDFIVDVLAMTS